MNLQDLNEAKNKTDKVIQMIEEKDSNLYSYIKTLSFYELLVLIDKFKYTYGPGSFYLEHKDVLKNIFTIIINKLNKSTLNISNSYLENEEKYFDISYFINRIYKYDWIKLLKNELQEIYSMLYRLPYTFFGRLKKDNYNTNIIAEYYPDFIREIRKEKGLLIGENAFKETTSLSNQTHKEILDYLWLEKTRMTYHEHYQRLLGIKDKEVLNKKYPKLERTLK